MLARTLGVSAHSTTRFSRTRDRSKKESTLCSDYNEDRGVRATDIVHTVGVTLEELYTGKRKKFEIQRNVICDECDGCGLDKEATKENGVLQFSMEQMVEQGCAVCSGTGTRIIHFGDIPTLSLPAKHSVLSGLTHNKAMLVSHPIRKSTTCVHCKGSGKITVTKPTTTTIRPRCSKCNGNRTVPVKSIVRLHVVPGMPSEHRLIFRGQGDEDYFSATSGDLVFNLKQKDHPVFKRSGDHLLLEKKLTSQEAANGFSFNLCHLDGRVLHVVSNHGIDTLLPDGEIKVIKNEGMPIQGTERRGDLIIRFIVEK